MFVIETLTLGCWETADEAETLEDAITLASSKCYHPCCKPTECKDGRVRISTPDGQAL